MDTANEAAQPSLRYRLVALAAGMPATMCFTIILPIMPKMEEALAHGANDAMLVKMTVAINGLAMVIGAPLAGYLTDKVGRGLLLLWSFLLWAGLGFSGYFIDDLRVMVATRFLVGIVTSFAATIGLTMLGDITDQAARNRLIGIASTVQCFTGVVVLPISGMLGDIGWRMPFLLYLASLPLAILASGVALTTNTRMHARATATAPAAPSKDPFPWPWGIMGLALIIGIVNTANVTYMPFVLRDLGATSATQIATAISVKSAIIGILAALYGYARTRMSVHTTLTVSLLLAATGAILVSMSPSFLIGAMVLWIWGAGMGWFSPTIAARATEASTLENRGRVIGLVKGVQLSASFPMVFIFEPILRAGGYRAVVMTCGLILMAMAVYYLARYRPWVRQTAPAA
jgi:MFS family permease